MPCGDLFVAIPYKEFELEVVTVTLRKHVVSSFAFIEDIGVRVLTEGYSNQ